MDKKDRRIAELETLLRNALERIVELERRLGLNSTNSSKLPSSDGFRKKPSPKSLRITGQNPSGGQKGHKGHTLDRVETPDKVVIYGVDSCRSCQKSCADIPVSKRTSRQVKAIPQSHIDVTEHQIKKKYAASDASIPDYSQREQRLPFNTGSGYQPCLYIYRYSNLSQKTDYKLYLQMCLT